MNEGSAVLMGQGVYPSLQVMGIAVLMLSGVLWKVCSEPGAVFLKV